MSEIAGIFFFNDGFSSLANSSIFKKYDLILISDSRIDNAKELISTLNIPLNSTDNEVLLEAYKKWGEDCPSKIIGDFTFVIWDKKEQKLFCVRDALGIKPFFYYKGNDFFAFASHPKAIFEFPNVTKELDANSLLNYLIGNYKDYENTEFKNLYRLLPAHSLTVTKGKIILKQYWDINTEDLLNLKTIGEYKEIFIKLFTDSITNRIKPHEKSAVLLSGGLDSSSIMCMIYDLKSRGIIHNAIPAYSALFQDVPLSEEKYVLSIKDKYNSEINFVNVNPDRPFWELPEALHKDSLPPISQQFYFFNNIAKQAHIDNIKVLLSGHGGDELLDSPLISIFNFLLKTNPLEIINYLKNFMSFHEVSFNYIASTLLKTALTNYIPKNFKYNYNFQQFKKKYDWLSQRHLKQGFKNIRANPWFAKNNKILSPTYSAIFSGHIKRELEEVSLLVSQNGIELRMPFHDRILIEFLARIPDEKLVYKDIPKGLLRKALSNLLPKEILNRKHKLGYTFKINNELIKKHRDRVNELLKSSILEDLGLINSKIAKDEFESYCNKYKNELDSVYGITNLVNVISLESWLRRAGVRSGMRPQCNPWLQKHKEPSANV